MLSVIIPAYNAPDLLAKYLPILLKALKASNLTHEIIVVDDGSEKPLRVDLPGIRLVRLEKNSGFAHACNVGARQSRFDKLFFINSDVEVNPNTFRPLLENFSDSRLFAVSPSILIPEEKDINEALIFGRLRGSNILLKIGGRTAPAQATEILYASGAAMMVDRQKFFEIGGFDEIYNPFYYEDFDLCYQAWKRGYRVLYEPRSTVLHLHSKTIKAFRKKAYIEAICRRNHYLFRWKNFTDPWLVFLMILELLTLKLINPNPSEWIGFFKALRKLPVVIKRRKEIKPFAKLSDFQIFTKFKHLL